jgi:TPP-dependent pyruvate/acetoin dehydrogenase alpha subunit
MEKYNNWKLKFYTIWAGQAVSLITSAILQMAIIFYLTEKTGSAMVLSMASLVGFLPYAVFGPAIGVLVDRHDRKKIMIGADLIIAAAGAVLAIVALYMDKGILGANGIVGGEIPIATGAAYTAKYLGTNQVAVSFFGDGASNEGTFHESINMASAWSLPVIYVIENNLYGISVDIRDVTNVENLADRAIGYGIPGVVVDGMDVLAVHREAEKAVKRARNGGGPTIIECKTYRWQGHHVGDPGEYRARRNENEKAEWMARCPVENLRKVMLAEYMSEDEVLAMEATVEEEIQNAVKFAIDSPYPDVSEAYTDVFVE